MASGRDPNDWQGPRACGKPTEAFIFSLLFQVLISQIYLNLVIAIIVDAFTGFTTTSKLPVNERLIERF